MITFNIIRTSNLHMMVKKTVMTGLVGVLSLLATTAMAQVEYQWMNVGDFHNFYGSIGSEIEEGFIQRQQAGAQWPAIYDRQDMQAAKAMWIGARNVVDESGVEYPVRVLHVGPRVSGLGYFVPTRFEVHQRFDQPQVLAEGIPSFEKDADISEVDPSLPADRVIYNSVNTAMGVTMDRTIYAFSNELHGNYHIIEMTFTNTGNVDEDDDIELPNETIEDFVVYLQNRWSVSRATRYTMGNATAWGFNAMTDRRGDGIATPDADPIEEQFKASFTWHGYYPNPSATPSGAPSDYDNIGAPIWEPNANDGLQASDTTGRLGSYQWIGRLHLSAPAGSNGEEQPLTMNEVGSDDNLNFRNDPFNQTKMTNEYALMTEGRTQRHAYRVEPTGLPGFLDPSTDPSLGTSGGWSAATGYGPYTLAPGESVTIVYAEAAAGIDKETANRVGRQFKRGAISNMDKNLAVFQGRDSLFMTFERIQDAYDNGNINVPAAPQPPSLVEVNGGGDGIFIDWEYPADEVGNISGFEIYRMGFSKDSAEVFVGEVDVSATNSDGSYSFVDDDFTVDLETGEVSPPIRGRDYFYYIQAVSAQDYYTGVQQSDFQVDGDLYPDGKLRSSRYFTQTYTPARLKRPAGETMDEITIAPNPYIASAGGRLALGANIGEDRIAFYDIPGRCQITIYTELGEKIATINHDDGSGDNYWGLRTDAQQRVVSGLYLAVIKNLETGEKSIKKFVVIL